MDENQRIFLCESWMIPAKVERFLIQRNPGLSVVAVEDGIAILCGHDGRRGGVFLSCLCRSCLQTERDWKSGMVVKHGIS